MADWEGGGARRHWLIATWLCFQYCASSGSCVQATANTQHRTRLSVAPYSYLAPLHYIRFTSHTGRGSNVRNPASCLLTRTTTPPAFRRRYKTISRRRTMTCWMTTPYRSHRMHIIKLLPSTLLLGTSAVPLYPIHTKPISPPSSPTTYLGKHLARSIPLSM